MLKCIFFPALVHKRIANYTGGATDHQAKDRLVQAPVRICPFSEKRSPRTPTLDSISHQLDMVSIRSCHEYSLNVRGGKYVLSC